MAMLPAGYGTHEALIFDVHTGSVRYCPLLEPDAAYPIYIPVDGGIFALADDSLELLFKPPHGAHLDVHDLFWRKLSHVQLPFDCKDVTSYAVHSDEETIFVGTDDYTFTYNTEGALLGANDHSRWERHSLMLPLIGHGLLGANDHSRWERHSLMLPFIGHGHFDCLLQAWVGLSRECPGHLCSCEVVSVYFKDALELSDKELDQSSDEDSEQSSADEWERPADEWETDLKVSKEKLFVLHPQEKLVGSYCGVRSCCCLLQCISLDEKLEEQSMSADEKLEEQSASLLRLSTFFVQYDKNGDLTVGDRQIQDYILPESVSEQFRKNPVAFWM